MQIIGYTVILLPALMSGTDDKHYFSSFAALNRGGGRWFACGRIFPYSISVHIHEQSDVRIIPKHILSRHSGFFVGFPIFPVVIFSARSEEHTSELQSRPHLVCRLLLEKKK